MRPLPRVATLLAALACGCGESPPPAAEPTPSAVSDVPDGVLKAARDRLPGVAFDRARRVESGGGLTYELRGRDGSGADRSATVSASGEVLRVE